MNNYPVRGQDSYGSGEYGAPRSKRNKDGSIKRYGHNGVDFECPPGSDCRSICDGEVTKIGYPYSNDLSFRYVQVTDEENLDYRYFYIGPVVHRGAKVKAGDLLGKVQDLTKRYPVDDDHPEGIRNHYHFEVKKDGEYLNPMQFLQRSEV